MEILVYTFALSEIKYQMSKIGAVVTNGTSILISGKKIQHDFRLYQIAKKDVLFIYLLFFF